MTPVPWVHTLQTRLFIALIVLVVGVSVIPLVGVIAGGSGLDLTLAPAGLLAVDCVLAGLLGAIVVTVALEPRNDLVALSLALLVGALPVLSSRALTLAVVVIAASGLMRASLAHPRTGRFLAGVVALATPFILTARGLLARGLVLRDVDLLFGSSEVYARQSSGGWTATATEEGFGIPSDVWHRVTVSRRVMGIFEQRGTLWESEVDPPFARPPIVWRDGDTLLVKTIPYEVASARGGRGGLAALPLELAILAVFVSVSKLVRAPAAKGESPTSNPV
jgi:hypothetical protein